MLRWMMAGESRGEVLTMVLEGVPVGVRIASENIRAVLARRRLGHGCGARRVFERDELWILGGIRHGNTVGSLAALQIANPEWSRWSTVMSANPVALHDLLIDAGTDDECEIIRNRPLTRPRPGHAGLPGILKYDLPEACPVLERALTYETTAHMTLRAVTETFLEQAAGIRLVSHVVRTGPAALSDDVLPPRAEGTEHLNADPARCTDPVANAAIVIEIDATRKDGDTLGSVTEVIVTDVPVGLGTHVNADRRLDARLAVALMGIQAVKGVEIGDGFVEAARRSSAAHDEIVPVDCGRLARPTNHTGGIGGGIPNGSDMRARVAFKPIPTMPRALRTADLATSKPTARLHQRSDIRVVVPGTVIAQTMTALVLADLLLDKTRGDSVDGARCNLRSCLGCIAGQTQW